MNPTVVKNNWNKFKSKYLKPGWRPKEKTLKQLWERAYISEKIIHKRQEIIKKEKSKSLNDIPNII